MSNLNALVHERDRLLARVEDLERAAERRHWIALICDRCGSKLEVASTLAIPDDRMQRALDEFAVLAGWVISCATAEMLGATVPGTTERVDLCHVCRSTARDR